MNCKTIIIIVNLLIFNNVFYAQGQEIFSVVREGNLEEVKQLIENNKDLIHEKNQNDCIPLHYSSYYGLKEITEYFIQKGADINARSDEGETPLHYAIYSERLEIIRLLIQKGADIHIRCIRGRTPFHVVSRENGNVEIGELLIENGADINTKDNYGRTPLAYSAFRRHKEFVKLLLGKGAQVPLKGEEADDLLHKAAIGGHIELFEYMIDHGVNIETRSYYGGTILHSAASGGLAESMENLLKIGLNINEECRYGLKPIHYAAIEGKKNVLDMLIKKGADINTMTKIGKTPLDYARELENNEIVDFLIQRGASKDTRAFTNFEGKYFNQKTPDTNAEIFALGLVSSEFGVHSSPAFMPDGTEVYWSLMDSRKGGIYYTKIENNKWIIPKIAAFSSGYHCANPVLSPDGSKLFFHSERPVEKNGKPGFGIWYVERSGKAWSSPKQIAASVRDSSPGWQVSLDKDSHIYFSTRGSSDIYISKYLNGNYSKPENLGPSINTEYNDNDPFVDKNAEYMVFSSNRPGGSGGFDIYVTFQNENGTWEKARNIGNGVNSKNNEMWPVISPDGRYLFFASNRNGHVDVYWIETKIIEKLKPEYSK
jgi:ankyrin repeat protein/Tol biopolymer transport system component